MIEFGVKLNIVMELIDGEGTDLMEHIQRKGRLSEYETHRLFRQILSAVAYCHSNEIVHRGDVMS